MNFKSLAITAILLFSPLAFAGTKVSTLKLVNTATLTFLNNPVLDDYGAQAILLCATVGAGEAHAAVVKPMRPQSTQTPTQSTAKRKKASKSSARGLLLRRPRLLLRN